MNNELAQLLRLRSFRECFAVDTELIVFASGAWENAVQRNFALSHFSAWRVTASAISLIPMEPERLPSSPALRRDVLSQF